MGGESGGRGEKGVIYEGEPQPMGGKRHKQAREGGDREREVGSRGQESRAHQPNFLSAEVGRFFRFWAAVASLVRESCEGRLGVKERSHSWRDATPSRSGVRKEQGGGGVTQDREGRMYPVQHQCLSPN